MALVSRLVDAAACASIYVDDALKGEGRDRLVHVRIGELKQMASVLKPRRTFCHYTIKLRKMMIDIL